MNIDYDRFMEKHAPSLHRMGEPWIDAKDPLERVRMGPDLSIRHRKAIYPMKTHSLKLKPALFNAVKSGTCKAIVEHGDFMVGDTLEISEFVPCPKCYGTGKSLLVMQVGDRKGMTAHKCDCCLHPFGDLTGENLTCKVTHVIQDDFKTECVLSVEVIL